MWHRWNEYNLGLTYYLDSWIFPVLSKLLHFLKPFERPLCSSFESSSFALSRSGGLSVSGLYLFCLLVPVDPHIQDNETTWGCCLTPIEGRLWSTCWPASMLQSGELCYFSIAPLILNVLNSPRLSSSASSATLRVLLGSWVWRLSRSPCGPTCQRTPWDPPWWRSASLQARERWLQAESLLLTRRKSGKMIVSIQKWVFFSPCKISP